MQKPTHVCSKRYKYALYRIFIYLLKVTDYNSLFGTVILLYIQNRLLAIA